ncbi:hypothetical protein AAHE18_08G004800 [Arachis hypogaea]
MFWNPTTILIIITIIIIIMMSSSLSFVAYPSFKFWFSITKAVCYAFLMTFISVLDVPVFWPILLCYWIVLFILTMKRQIMHMIKYKYVPFNLHKKRYNNTRKKSGISCKP